ncbi:pupal cuticle protein G1A [Toxorhynchites rutilus septentrionalis]|uniref:pupal cuticle protein G1A n=1 Tax=Toxorhynchites rutilus septentrionalis TaxID=329112 RepID=UPI002478FAE7|nr:pupal cuticle protein G1A [Toxorhynchites rutilus septentrionalis]
MKIFIVLLAIAAVVCAEQMSESMKTKRGLHLNLGYHAHPYSHSYVAHAPVIAHSAPLIAAPVYHAPIAKTYVSHTPIVHHAPVIASYHHAPAIAVAHAPVYHAFHRR